MLIRVLLAFIMLFCTSATIKTTAPSFDQEGLVFRQATVADLEKLLLFLNECVSKEPEKIVVLPSKFLPQWLSRAVLNSQLFLAELISTKEIVGIKRMYLITDELQLENILWNEIRCLGPEARQTDAGFFYWHNDSLQYQECSTRPLFNIRDLYIYNGTDFTHPYYRGLGINSALTNLALQTVAEKLDQSRTRSAPYIHLVYGLAYPNAGEKPGDQHDRTVALVKHFCAFAWRLQHTLNPMSSLRPKLRYLRYQSLMPRFDDSGSELAVIFDALNEPKYGCILSYQLDKPTDQKQ